MGFAVFCGRVRIPLCVAALALIVVGNFVAGGWVAWLGVGALVVYAMPAHLRRRSIRVHKGERVAAGQQLASCGNSGNSTEPHVHFQLMDKPNVLVAAGLPASFAEMTVEAGNHSGMPANGQPFLVGETRQP